MFKIEQGRIHKLEVLANNFYSQLNPITINGSLYKNSLKSRLAKTLRTEKAEQKRNFYKMLSKSKYKLLRQIITGNPSELDTIYKKLNELIIRGRILPFSYEVDGVIKSTKFGKEVLELFNYKSCRGNLKFIWLVNELNINICPYCNYTYTFKIKNKINEIILHEFDHFIPKVVAPYLSLSFFNLIPSCHTCNSTLKGATIFTLENYIHPYVDNLHSNISFSINKPILNDDLKSFDVKIETISNIRVTKERSERTYSLFEIEQRYNNFKDDVLRLNKLSEQYNETRKKELLDHGFLGIVFKDRSDLMKHIALTLDLPLNENQAKRMEKGKLKLDIARKFSIIDYYKSTAVQRVFTKSCTNVS